MSASDAFCLRYKMEEEIDNGSKIRFCYRWCCIRLGKGITAASLGRLLKARGYQVTMQKFDPYINIDPGTMNLFSMERFLLQMMVQRQIWILDIMRDLLMRALIKTRM